MARAQLVWLLLAFIVRLDEIGAIPCDGDCVVKAERITPNGPVPLDSTQPIVTAVGCLETLEFTYGSHSSFGTSAQPPKVVLMIKSDKSSTITASTVLDDSEDGLQNRICCREHPMDRDALLLEAGMNNKKCRTEQALYLTPMDLFSDCMIQYPGVKDMEAGTMKVRIQFIVPERADMTLEGEEQVMGTSDGTNSFLLQAEYEQANGQSFKAHFYSVKIQVQRCSACLNKGEGLNGLAKRFGTHWTQVYSANQDIVGSPDDLEEARVLRLGSLYSVRAGDTLMSVALKFGVTVNQLFSWNGFMRTMLDTMPENPNHMSRALTVGQVSLLPCHVSACAPL